MSRECPAGKCVTKAWDARAKRSQGWDCCVSVGESSPLLRSAWLASCFVSLTGHSHTIFSSLLHSSFCHLLNTVLRFSFPQSSFFSVNSVHQTIAYRSVKIDTTYHLYTSTLPIASDSMSFERHLSFAHIRLLLIPRFLFYSLHIQASSRHVYRTHCF